jgi:hypothetical protein
VWVSGLERRVLVKDLKKEKKERSRLVKSELIFMDEKGRAALEVRSIQQLNAELSDPSV